MTTAVDTTLMRAAVLRGANDLAVLEIARPTPGPGEVLVQVKVSGICGSDLPRVLGGAARRYPLVLGHEFSGVIAEVGDDVDLTPGMRVAGVPLVPCGDCVDCEQGHFSQCGHYSFLGSRVNGAWAQFVVVPATNLLPVSDEITFEAAAMIEPSTVALHAFHLANFTAGSRVAVIGAGNIGMFAIQWARILGASDITVFDIDAERLSVAESLGATRIQRSDLGDDAWIDGTNRRGFDLVIESSGVPVSFTTAIELVANKGTIVLVGTPTRQVAFEPRVFELLNRREATLLGSWMSYSAPFPGSEWTMTLTELTSGRLRHEELIAARFPLSEAHQAFDLYRSGAPVRGKVLLCEDVVSQREGSVDDDA